VTRDQGLPALRLSRRELLGWGAAVTLGAACTSQSVPSRLPVQSESRDPQWQFLGPARGTRIWSFKCASDWSRERTIFAVPGDSRGTIHQAGGSSGPRTEAYTGMWCMSLEATGYSPPPGLSGPGVPEASRSPRPGNGTTARSFTGSIRGTMASGGASSSRGTRVTPCPSSSSCRPRLPRTTRSLPLAMRGSGRSA
jgi:hypothetical protein